MIGKVAARREAKIASLVETAWDLASDEGVGGVTLHALARRAGMRQPSLYEYFGSKNALFDAMFADGNHRLLDRLRGLKLPRNPRAALKQYMRTIAQFALEDETRYMLLFQRPVPSFTPSVQSYAGAEEVLDGAVALLRAAGVDRQGDVDCIVAVVGGLIAAQMSNEPGGNRWVKHLDRMIDLYLDDALDTTRSSR